MVHVRPHACHGGGEKAPQDAPHEDDAVDEVIIDEKVEALVLEKIPRVAGGAAEGLAIHRHLVNRKWGTGSGRG